MSASNYVSLSEAKSFMEIHEDWQAKLYQGLYDGAITARGKEIFSEESAVEGQPPTPILDPVVPASIIGKPFWHRGRIDWDTVGDEDRTKNGPCQEYWQVKLDLSQIQSYFA